MEACARVVLKGNKPARDSAKRLFFDFHPADNEPGGAHPEVGQRVRLAKRWHQRADEDDGGGTFAFTYAFDQRCMHSTKDEMF